MSTSAGDYDFPNIRKIATIRKFTIATDHQPQSTWFRNHEDESYFEILDGGDIPMIANTAEYQYPSTWFDKNVGKPVIRINTSYSLDILRGAVVKGLNNGQLESHVVTAYLWKVFTSHPEVCPVEWTSFGRKICEPNQQITIENLTNVMTENREFPAEMVELGVTFDDKCLAILLCSGHRLNNIPQYDQFISNLNGLVSTIPCNFRFQVSHLANVCRDWSNDPEYVQTLCLIDMFLVRFPNHKLRDARIGTIVTRHKDCAALMELVYFSELLKCDYNEIATWIWNSDLADDFERIVKDGEEISDLHSYFPYFMEMKLSPKSPYSAAINDAFHLFVHIYGSLAGERRSINASMPNERDRIFSKDEIKRNAEVLFYAYSRAEDKTSGIAGLIKK